MQLQDIPGNYYGKIEHKLSSVANGLTKKSLKYLQKLHRQEEKLQNKLSRFNPGDSKDWGFERASRKYNDLVSELASERIPDDVKLLQYNPYLDTMGTSLCFLRQDRILPGNVKLPILSLDRLKSRMNQADKIKEFIGVRERQIHDALSKYIKQPASLRKAYQRLSKTAYYYSAQVNEIKDLLKDSKKLEQKTLSILSKLPAFQAFMREKGQLASLFQIPGNSSSENLSGLQTRASVQSLVQQNISSGGPNASAQIQQYLGLAHKEIKNLKNKINDFGGGNSDIVIPNFKPNSQKAKAFLKRLEYSADIQFSKVPMSAGIGFGLGYKLNDKSVIGIGLSYKMGLGKLAHIAISNQGVGLRSYMDWKIKKQLFISGGYEMNYNTFFKNINQLKDFNAWQRSSLLGMSKKYKVSKKVRGEMKLLYDFLANAHQPVSESLVFRMGYKF